MKRILLSILISFCASWLWAQPYENSWINYSQPYYKLKISSEGIYRISQQTLLFAGVQVTGNDPRKIQLFHNGVEQYIYIQGESDGTFDANDFIEFYGEKMTVVWIQNYTPIPAGSQLPASVCSPTLLFILSPSAIPSTEKG